MNHTDKFWQDQIKTGGDNVVIIAGDHYRIGNDKDKYKGFGGDTFYILFNDGRCVKTNNLWNQGTIPEKFRDVLKDNARFTIKSEYLKLNKHERNIK